MQKEEILPNISISHLQIRLEELKALTNTLKSEIEMFPSGRLRIAQRTRAHATRRRSRHLRRHNTPRTRLRLPSLYSPPPRPPRLRQVV